MKGRNIMKKIIYYFFSLIVVIAKFSARTPSQLGLYQVDFPKEDKK